MKRFLVVISGIVASLVAFGQSLAIDPSKPVSAADVEVTAVNCAIFEKDSIRIVSREEVEAQRQQSLDIGIGSNTTADGMDSEGAAQGPGAILFSYNYPSVDADGNKITLSSLMAVPTKMILHGYAKPNNLVIGCHVTITSNYQCPTEYNRTGDMSSWKTDVGMQIFYTRYDFIRQPCCLVIMPDYEGYGVSVTRPHPYLYQELTARQVVDAVRYGLALYNANINSGEEFAEFEDGWKSVCVGYSQGGSVSLATHRFIEENGLANELHFAGSVCGDGPYDPIEHLRYYMQDEGETYDGTNKTEHEKETVSMPVVMPLILKGMCDCNPFMRQHKVEDYLTEKFLDTGIIGFINLKSGIANMEQYSTDRINYFLQQMRKNGLTRRYRDKTDNKWKKRTYTADQMCSMLYKESGGNVHGRLAEIMTPVALEYFRDLKKDDPVPEGRGLMEDLHRALASNSLVGGWKPTHRIAFYHSTYDTVVPYVNLLSFIRHQDELSYFFHDKKRERSKAAGVNPTHITDEGSADVYIYDDNTTNDHVDAGENFYFWGVPSPDYKLMKWIFEGKN